MVLVDGTSWVCDGVVVRVDGVLDELPVEAVAVDGLGCSAGVREMVVGAAVADELSAATAATAADPVAPAATRIQVIARARARPASGPGWVMGISVLYGHHPLCGDQLSRCSCEPL